MRLRIVGCLCPDCGEEARRYDRKRHRLDWWMGYAYGCDCSGCLSSWWVLYQDSDDYYAGSYGGTFRGIVRADGGVDAAGGVEWVRDVDEIPF